MNKSILLLMVLWGVSCGNTQQASQEQNVEEPMVGVVVEPEKVCHNIVEHSDGMLIIYPQFSKVDLVCGTMPSMDDESVIFVAEAAYTCKTYTEKLGLEFEHKYVAGNHVTNGQYKEGYPCSANTGAFVYYNGAWKFLYDYYASELKTAAENGGMGFGQELILKDGVLHDTVRGDAKANIYRALCELSGELCIIESEQKIPFGEFKQKLLSLGVTNAIYLDMGSGWNHAWYRTEEGVEELHPRRHNFCTNWITFYK